MHEGHLAHVCTTGRPSLLKLANPESCVKWTSAMDTRTLFASARSRVVLALRLLPSTPWIPYMVTKLLVF